MASIRPLLAVSRCGFELDAVSGRLFVIADPDRHLANAGFRFKMLLLSIAGLNALWFHWRIRPEMHTRPPHGDAPASARTIALVSLVAWTGILLLGRLISWIGTG